ncbi:MAG: prepilin-type N-terminal cleavage/methylation domain-containing protein [Bacilli bacterium]|nr:prepilin-type N-terminal cleavage/methylation domain-containing protein [Bacilli bacterium]
MNKKGFTLVEMLAVMIVVSLLMVLVVPAIVNVYTSVRRNSFTTKVNYIETNTLKYVNSFKDDIKNQSCVDYTIDQLISVGAIISDNKGVNQIENPYTGGTFDGKVRVCYCKSKLDVVANYVEEYNASTYYHKGDKIIYNDILYTCINDSEPNKLFDSNSGNVNTNYFQVIEC